MRGKRIRIIEAVLVPVMMGVFFVPAAFAGEATQTEIVAVEWEPVEEVAEPVIEDKIPPRPEEADPKPLPPAVVLEASGYEEARISPEAYDACVKWGEADNIQPELLMAIIEPESGGNPNAVNGEYEGLMQISTRWHSARMVRLGCDDLFDPDQNIQVGADYLRELFEQYGDQYLVLMLYSMNNETAFRLYGRGIYSEYAVNVSKRAEELALLHEYKAWEAR